MKILKIFGAVLAIHAVAFMLIFANPGCSSTSKPAPAAAASEPAPSSAVVTLPAPAAEISPITVAAVSANPGASGFDPNAPAISSPVRYSPTRPGTPAASAVQAQPVTDVVPATTYTVGNGDSLWTIAKKNHLTVGELAAANNLPASAKLKLGQRLIIPSKSPGGAGAAAAVSHAGPVYKVRTGDNLALIAKRAGTNTAALKEMNSLKSDTVWADQDLKLPAGATMAADPMPAAAAGDTPAAKLPSGSVTHLVKPGETLGTIARKYQVKQGEIAVANNITNPALIRSGMTLVIPGWQAPKSAKTAEAAPAAAKAGGEQNPLIKISATDLRPDPGAKRAPAADVPVIKIDDYQPANPPKGH